MNVRHAISLLTPPAFVHLARVARERLDNRLRREWEYVPDGWEAAERDPAIKGWNVRAVLQAYQARWPSFLAGLDGTRPFGVSPESVDASGFDIVTHNLMMMYGYVLALANNGCSSISMLDWGGGIGHYYAIGRALMPGADIEYHCKDVPLLVEYGRTLFPDAHFYSDDTCLARTYELVLVSGALQYSPDWQRTLSRLAGATGRYLYVTNLPIVRRAPSFVFVQRPYRYGYDTEYLGWCLNRQELLDCASGAGMELVREFIVGHRPPIYKAPEQNEYCGFLFRPAVSRSSYKGAGS